MYGFKKFICENDEINNQRTIKGCEYIDFVTKDNGSEIPLGFFSNNQMPEISAVLFSNVATFGKIRAMTKDIDKRKMYFTYSKYNKAGLHPNEGIALKENYTESLESGLTIFLNPYAKHPIPQEFIDTLPGFTSYDTYNRCINGEAVDGNLINRMVQVFTLRE